MASGASTVLHLNLHAIERVMLVALECQLATLAILQERPEVQNLTCSLLPFSVLTVSVTPFLP